MTLKEKSLNMAVNPASVLSHASMGEDLINTFRTVRHQSDQMACGLSPEDQNLQSMPGASPMKWHRAHTTWFFEKFVL
jgi:hypothetical protein